ncbi:MAG: B12-binding domain-containing radical SAM protein [Desulfomonile tiedjei]|uniref:B12-binding domain-containing radical SAM protein n=1 Tax=Desulfomonile tiedjei TaxID=2358 RepID=A0A9D6Z1R8_9BACT|nr:B12-binding domain-containing radical SAM protein [Desulfomonile tiedjei]
MKILLIPNPVLRRGLPTTYVPLGILSLATVLRNDGFNAEIFDINALSSDPTYRDVPEAILAQQADVIGFSAWCNMYFYLVRFAEIIKKKRPETKIVFGGVHATHTDVETLRDFPQIDLVVRGECDHTISSVMRSIYDVNALKRVAGLSFRDGNEIIRTPYSGPVQNMNDIPVPDYSLFPSIRSVDCISIDIGRGCPFRCAYCVSNQMSERKFRIRSVESVIGIVKALVSEYKNTNLRFEHDLLTLNRQWLVRLCDELVKEKLDVHWTCFSRIDTVDEGVVDRMADAGCRGIYFGIESGSARMQEILNKRLKLDMAIPIVRRACEKGIEVTSGFITGFPQEKLEDIADTMRLIMELCLAGDRGVSLLDFWLLVPFPGSPLFEQYGHTLSLDERLSDFAVHPKTPVDIRFIKQYPKVFSTLYHYASEYLERDIFLRVIYLMANLSYMRYTSFILLKDNRFGFPEKFLEQLQLLELPSGNIYNSLGHLSELVGVCEFIKAVFGGPEFEYDLIHELMKFDLVWHAVRFSEEDDRPIRIEDFSYDIIGFIKEARSNRFTRLPKSVNRESCSVLFRKSGETSVDVVRMPALFNKKTGTGCG